MERRLKAGVRLQASSWAGIDELFIYSVRHRALHISDRHHCRSVVNAEDLCSLISSVRLPCGAIEGA